MLRNILLVLLALIIVFFLIIHLMPFPIENYALESRKMVDASPEIVFQYLTDPSMVKRWFGGFSHRRYVTPQPLRRGSEFYDVIIIDGDQFEAHTGITSFAPGRNYSYVQKSRGLIQNCAYYLEERDGKTLVRFTRMVEYHNTWVKFLSIFKPRLTNMKIEEDLARMASIIEIDRRLGKG